MRKIRLIVTYCALCQFPFVSRKTSTGEWYSIPELLVPSRHFLLTEDSLPIPLDIVCSLLFIEVDIQPFPVQMQKLCSSLILCEELYAQCELSVADPGFTRRVRQSKRLRRQPIIWPNVFRKLHEMKEIGPRKRGSESLSPSCIRQ